MWSQVMKSRRLFHSLTLILSMMMLVAGCSTIPRDPEGTLKRVQSGRLRVGLVESPPWVVRTNGEPAGAEVALVRQLAQELNATPEWHWGGEQQHMEALEHYELDLVLAGLDTKTPWKKRVGVTSPYFEERVVVGIPSSAPQPKSLKGLTIAVKGGEATASYLESKSAVPQRVDDLSQVSGAVAAPIWELEKLGLTKTEFELFTEQHVMATPPGENGWLKRVDEFLHKQGSQTINLLQQESARR